MVPRYFVQAALKDGQYVSFNSNDPDCLKAPGTIGYTEEWDCDPYEYFYGPKEIAEKVDVGCCSKKDIVRVVLP